MYKYFQKKLKIVAENFVEKRINENKNKSWDLKKQTKKNLKKSKRKVNLESERAVKSI